jgi:preprotein translocase subunit SecD
MAWVRLGRRAAAAVAGGALLFGAGCGFGDDGPAGWTRVTLTATLPAGNDTTAATALTNAALERSGEILTARFEAAGLADPRLAVDGDRLVATFADEADRQLVEALVMRGELRFRKVLEAVPDGGPAQQSGDLADGWDALPTAAERLAAVEAKVGEVAWAEAAALTGPVDPDTEPDLMAVLAPFAPLVPEEVAVLPVELQFQLPQIVCATLADRPAAASPDRLPTVACDGELKYRLDEAKVTGGDIAGGVAELSTVSAEWYVELTFTESGQARWTALSEEAVQNPDGACQISGAGGSCQVAIVLDGTVISAPQVIDVIRGPAQITGGFSRAEAELLAAQLGHGELPLVLQIDSFGADPAG